MTDNATAKSYPYKTMPLKAAPKFSENITKIISPNVDNEIKTRDGKISLKVPKGAVAENIRVELIERAPYASSGKQMISRIELNASYANRKDKFTKFNKDLELTFKPTEKQLKGLNPASLRLYCFDNATKKWVPVAGSTMDAKQLLNRSSINHFSEYSWQADPLVNGPGKIMNTQVNLNSGSASFKYPIELPPGPGGFQPRLNLLYNSGIVDEMKDKRATGSWVGIGWSLHAGRISKSLLSDEYSLDLDGISYKLVSISSQTTDNITQFRTEPDCYYKITKNGNLWEMLDRDGNYYRFSDVRIAGANPYSPYRWDISQFSDANNNQATVSYVCETSPQQAFGCRASYPEFLRYGNVEVRFFMSSTDNNAWDGLVRMDSPVSWPQPVQYSPFNPAPVVMETRQLDAIEIKVSGTLVRKYIFTYNTTTRVESSDYGGIYYSGKHTLTSIQQLGADGTSQLPPMSFTYADKQLYFKDTTRSDYSGNPGNPVSISWPYLTNISSGYGGNISFTYEQMPDTSVNDTWTRQIAVNKLVNSGSGLSENYTYIYTSGPQYAMERSMTAEYRGFGQVRETAADGNYITHSYYTAGSPSIDKLKGREYNTKWYSSTNTLLKEVSDNWTVKNTNQEAVGTYKKAYGHWDIPQPYPSAPLHDYQLNAFGMALAGDGSLYVADTGHHRIIKWNGDNVTHMCSSPSPRGLLVTSDNYLYVVESSNNRVVKINTGGAIQSTFGSAELAGPSGIARSPDNYFYVADTGHNRIVKYDASGNYVTAFGGWTWVSGGHWDWNEWEGLHWVTEYSSDGLASPWGVTVSPDNYIYVADTGHNRIVKYTSSGTYVSNFGSYTYASGGHYDIDPFGELVWVIDYTTISPSGPKGISASSNNFIFLADTNNNRIMQYDLSGNYQCNFGPWAQITGGQYLYDIELGWYWQWSYDAGSLSTPQNVYSAPNNYIYVSDGYVDYSTIHMKIIKYAGYFSSYAVQLQKRDVTVGNKTSRTQYVYDDYGNVIAQFNEGDTSTVADDSTVFNLYYPNTTKNILGKPARSRVYSGIRSVDSGGDNLTVESMYYYDGNNTSLSTPPTKGNLTRLEQKINTSTSISTYYTYDSYGNMLTQQDPRGNTTTFTYDATHHTYPVTKSYPIAGMSESYSWDIGTNNKLSETDINGQTTSYQYDTFKRRTKMIRPGDSEASPSVAYQYNNWGTINQQNIRAIQKVSDNQTLWQSVYFDGIGRIMQAHACGESGRTIISSTTAFNNRGLAEKQYVSQDLDTATVNGYKPPEASWKYSTTTYDCLKRVLTVVKADGTTVSHDYATAWQELVTNEKGIKKRYYYDAFSNIWKIEELDASQAVYATTNYTYDVLNRLRQVRDNSNNTTSITYDWLSRKTAMTDPDMGSWSYSYDNNGNLTGQTDAKSQTITLAYDALNRVTGKSYPAGSGMTNITYSYDDTNNGNVGKGRRTGMTDALGTSSYKFDARGRLLAEKRTVDSVDYTTQFTYDSADRVASVTYPTGEVVASGYNLRGLPYSLSGSTAGAIVNSVLYNQLGQMTEINLGNSVRTTYGYWGTGGAYDTAGGYYGKLWEIKVSKQPGGSPVLMDVKHTWDAGGNLTQREDVGAAQTETFGYDFLDRLTSVSGPYSESYAYNQIGNITSKNGTAYTYGTKPHAVTAVGAANYSYDSNGNMTSRAGANIIWDVENRPKTVSDNNTYVYDGDGKRVKKTEGGQTILYINQYFEKNITISENTTYYFMGGKMTAMRKGTALQYMHQDHLTGTAVMSDSAGAQVGTTMKYFPFGATRSGSVPTDIKFTGQRLDGTGLYYFNARYYDPVIGRFISADTIVPGAFSSQSLNRYSYVLNNPLKYNDPSGHDLGKCTGWDSVEPNGGRGGGHHGVGINPLGTYNCNGLSLPGWSIICGFQMAGKGFAENMQAQNCSLSVEVLESLGLDANLGKVEKCLRPDDTGWPKGATSCRTGLICIAGLCWSEAIYEIHIDIQNPLTLAMLLLQDDKGIFRQGAYLGPGHTSYRSLPDAIYLNSAYHDQAYIVAHESFHAFQWRTIENFEYLQSYKGLYSIFDRDADSWAQFGYIPGEPY